MPGAEATWALALPGESEPGLSLALGGDDPAFQSAAPLAPLRLVWGQVGEAVEGKGQAILPPPPTLGFTDP